MQTLMSLVGIATVFGIALALSKHRGDINPRTVGIAFLIQVAIGAFVLYVPSGGNALDVVVRGVQSVINYGNDGIEFLFGSKINDSP